MLREINVFRQKQVEAEQLQSFAKQEQAKKLEAEQKLASSVQEVEKLGVALRSSFTFLLT